MTTTNNKVHLTTKTSAIITWPNIMYGVFALLARCTLADSGFETTPVTTDNESTAVNNRFYSISPPLKNDLPEETIPDTNTTLKDDVYKKTLKDEVYEKTLNDEVYEKTLKDDEYEKTLKDDVYENTLKDEVYEKTLKDDVYEKTLKDELYEKTLEDEVYKKTLKDEEQSILNCIFSSIPYVGGQWLTKMARDRISDNILLESSLSFLDGGQWLLKFIAADKRSKAWILFENLERCFEDEDPPTYSKRKLIIREKFDNKQHNTFSRTEDENQYLYMNPHRKRRIARSAKYGKDTLYGFVILGFLVVGSMIAYLIYLLT
ncbi:hypothetical protein SK128_009726 [Halocaridina rubra]|uniref:Uncharacterized protein n=1 Tax=Halocaridina rubra TaxID=373956 RepID=A0AAN8ZY65_HALRR